MAAFFPTQTGTFRLEDRHAFRRISMSVVEMAVLTGIVLRVYRALILSRGDTGGWLFVAASLSAGVILLFGMLTLHLSGFTVRTWVWRVPAFAAIEAATESLVSLGLIALQREPLGTTRAAFGDWPAMVVGIIGWRVTTIVLFALLLAGMVQTARYLLIRRDHRDHTFQAVHTAEREAHRPH